METLGACVEIMFVVEQPLLFKAGPVTGKWGAIAMPALRVLVYVYWCEILALLMRSDNNRNR